MVLGLIVFDLFCKDNIGSGCISLWVGRSDRGLFLWAGKLGLFLALKASASGFCWIQILACFVMFAVLFLRMSLGLGLVPLFALSLLSFEKFWLVHLVG